MKLVCVKKKNSRRKQAISSHNPYCFVSFLGGPFKFTADGLKKYLDVSRILRDGVNQQPFPRATSKIKVDMCSL